jgi:hypothetical protein
VFSARQGTADVRLPPEYDQVIHSMWRLAQSGEVVAAEQVALAAARMASGESLDSVVASLGT